MDDDGAYQAYAPIYDRTGQERFGAYMAGLALAWLRANGVAPQRALDLACGTGGATLALAAAGIETTGLDRSSAMLRIARDRARVAGLAVTFVEADMRDMEALVAAGALHRGATPSPGDCVRRFGLVTCFGDAINYLTGDDDLPRVFAGIRCALEPGGYVVFDVNTEAAFAQWDERDLVIHESDDCLVCHRLTYHPATRLGRGRIVWLTHSDDNRWWRGEETHIERAWSDAEIQRALEVSGLAPVERLAVDGRNVADVAPLPERLIYIATTDRL
ncbi:methyltransferase domain-containing protein [Roseiflexus castenholzii]|uniref:Methyltransferase type 11 n=1 Tax=Roseiflexus castenholzii (strain DSM 13941 / HLO8) TaxID=383372 RepID=A7NFJ3_ROSCS|nr:class I SAM-dependent methyltransferase [Roseiflexus castenholzii]ABU56215.1 Methyltransferase type 11 [Roseiflexus castenholzii DSM 13941]